MLTVVHDRDVFKDGYNSGYDSGYDSRQEEVDQLNADLKNKDEVIADKDAIIAQLTAQLNDMKKNN